jgi:hypothetical protein
MLFDLGKSEIDETGEPIEEHNNSNGFRDHDGSPVKEPSLYEGNERAASRSRFFGAVVIMYPPYYPVESRLT